MNNKKSFDVLVWNDPLDKLQEPENPLGMVNVSEEHADLTEDEAWKIYDNCKSYYKVMMCYEPTVDGEYAEDGDIVAEDVEEEYLEIHDKLFGNNKD